MLIIFTNGEIVFKNIRLEKDVAIGDVDLRLAGHHDPSA